MKALLLSLIRFLTAAPSPPCAPPLPLYPTCSEYALEAVERYGASKGLGCPAPRRIGGAPLHRQESIESTYVP